MVNVPIVRGQISSFVTDVNINDNADDVNDGDNHSSNPSNFVPSTP
jgi:hypothetical protein